MQALGLIETRGLLAAIVCADVMLKSAQVELLERTLVGGGLVTIVVTGDVGAVKAAVEAGASAVQQLDRLSLISQHVIPRPHEEIEGIVVTDKNCLQNQQIPVRLKQDATAPAIGETQSEVDGAVPNQVKATVAVEPAESAVETVAVAKDKAVDESTAETAGSIKPAFSSLHKNEMDDIIRQSGIKKGIELLRSLSVVKLRNLAREYSELGLTGRAVSKAGKELLLQTFLRHYKSGTQQTDLQKP